MQVLSQNYFLLDGQSLTIQSLNQIVQQHQKIQLNETAWEKVRKSRNAVKAMMSEPNKIVYGINTGFGNFADKIITHDQREQLQINLIRSHAVGVGKPLDIKYVKKMIILRINTLSKGRSGIDPDNLEKYIKAYNNDFIPMIPEKGTVGASGDLAPLSHLALGMMGEGLAWDDQKQCYSPARQIMQKKGLQPIVLTQKEGLALINGTQFMSSIISEIAFKCQKVFQSAIRIYLYSIEVFGLETDLFFSDQSIEFYGSKNKRMGEIMKKMRGLLGQTPSQINTVRRQNAHKNNRCFSIIQAIENLTAFSESLEMAKKFITEELNSATDNPLVYLKEDGFQTDELISAGNFHGQYVAKASDFISMALFSLGRFSQARIQRYINERISNLPGFLVCNGGLNSGFMIIQYTSAALLSESKVLAKPGSADSISTSASQEDHVSMGGYAARKAKQMLENITFILGIQLLHCLQATDMIGKKTSPKLQHIKTLIRKDIPYFETDEFFGDAMNKAKQFVQNGLDQFESKTNQQ